jgi:diguanylate cyclase (GGDEF)-like protein/PAS domain S-box-containing protein
MADTQLPWHRRTSAYLVLLMLAVAVPFLLLLLKNVSDLTKTYHDSAVNDAVKLAKLTSSRLDGYIDGVEDLLDTVAVVVLSELDRTDQLAARLGAIKARLPIYVNAIQAIGLDGKVIAAAPPGQGNEPYTVGDRKYFKDALKGDSIGIGEPVVSRTTNKLALAFAKRILDAAGQPRVVVSVSIRLENFQDLLAAEQLPAGSVVTLLDQNNVVLARSLDAKAWVGKNLSNVAVVRSIGQRQEGGIEGASADGVLRLAGFTRAHKVPWWVYVGIPRDIALAPARAALWRSLLWAGAAALVGLAAALWWARRIARPIERLRGDLERWSSGDLAHRSGVSSSNEIGALAQHFNRVTQSLQQNTAELRASEKRLDLVIGATTDGVWDIDLATGHIFTSRKVKSLLGYGEDEIPTQRESFEMLLHPEDKQRALQALKDHIQHRTALADEFRLRTKSGEYIWIARHGQAEWDERGTATRVAGSIADITTRKLAELEVQRLHAELEQRVNDRTAALTREIIQHKQTQAQLETANDSLQQSLDQLRQQTREMSLLHEMSELLQSAHTFGDYTDVIAHSVQALFDSRCGGLFMLKPSRDLFEASATWGDFPANQEVFAPDECWALKLTKMHIADARGGRLKCAHVDADEAGTYLCAPLNSHGETIGLLHLRAGSEADAQKLRARLPLVHTVTEYLGLALGSFKLQQTWRFQSLRDPLTGLFNRRYMEESISREYSRSQRAGVPLGIIMFDLDHFKRLNDSYGHDAGDAVLRDLGKLLLERVRDTDIACRYGGEEFTVILPGADVETCCERADELLKLVRDMKVECAGQVLNDLSISLGVASYPQHGPSWQQVLKAADMALYQAKQRGRRCVAVAA